MEIQSEHFDEKSRYCADMAALAAVAEGASDVFRVLSNPQRLRILCALNSGACCVSQLEDNLGASQAYVSGQLARMRSEGVVTCARAGRQMVYSIADPRLQAVLAGLAQAVAQIAASQMAVSAQDQADNHQHQTDK
ncbi:ArsR/SmtB family transcription factor [Ketogulonicigenium vulgare]|uniref:ArsR/SmtB family transcription factor n=1 Tax=Ketogulonicigenium vulgare TaxID=92945 RepID=UPI00235971F2|nr:metalloregulator ArsR/SmtB family transcription factor [Ketogulonicigenium vulgare]